MTLKQRYFRITNLLFLCLIAVQFLPDKIAKIRKPRMFYGLRQAWKCLY